MSIEINWEKLTEDSGDQLSETIRQFLDQRFQEMALPSYLKSISVTSFDLGEVAPDIVIQRITDPFPEFYSDDELDDNASEADSNVLPSSNASDTDSTSFPPPAYDSSSTNAPIYTPSGAGGENLTQTPETLGQINTSLPHQQIGVGLYSPTNLQYLSSPLQSNIMPGIRSPLYSSVNMQSILSGSLSRTTSQISNGVNNGHSPHPTTNSTQTNSIASSSSSSANPLTNGSNRSNNSNHHGNNTTSAHPNASENDLQLYLHIMYKGDIKVGIETTLLLNYPSPKFVSLPLKLSMCSLEINSIAALAYIDKKIHFSFICDADAEGNPVTLSGKDRVEIIKDIKIESEIGDREGNGPVLRNVGKIERFLLDRLRYLARDELAWPGWITIEF